MKKIIVFREELNGNTPYDNIIGVCDTPNEAQSIIDTELSYLTTREKSSCKIYGLEYECEWDSDFKRWIPDEMLGGYDVKLNCWNH